MCDNLHLNSIRQCQTPLNSLFFSEFNVNLIQRAIRQKFKNDTGISIDYQNADDLFAIMRVVFINNSEDHFTDINNQVRRMNDIVIKTALSQVNTGVRQYMLYLNDINTLSVPNSLPVNTSTYGNKVGPAFKNIGIN